MRVRCCHFGLQILDKRGVCLFDKTWRWELDVKPERVAGLVHSMRQFSREIDEGGVSPVGCPLGRCTLFQLFLHSEHGRRARAHRPATSNAAARLPVTPDPLRMLRLRSSPVISKVLFNQPMEYAPAMSLFVSVGTKVAFVVFCDVADSVRAQLHGLSWKLVTTCCARPPVVALHSLSLSFAVLFCLCLFVVSQHTLTIQQHCTSPTAHVCSSVHFHSDALLVCSLMTTTRTGTCRRSGGSLSCGWSTAPCCPA